MFERFGFLCSYTDMIKKSVSDCLLTQDSAVSGYKRYHGKDLIDLIFKSLMSLDFQSYDEHYSLSLY